MAFGDARLKIEGCPIHPDDADADMTDEQYMSQLNAYAEATGDEAAFNDCVRDDLVNRAK